MIPTPTILPNGEYAEQKTRKSVFLSTGETQLIRNLAESITTGDDKQFLSVLADKEYITTEEKKRMNRILAEAASGFREDSIVF